jgi:hypothetical protein
MQMVSTSIGLLPHHACRYRAVRDHEDSPGRNLVAIVI